MICTADLKKLFRLAVTRQKGAKVETKVHVARPKAEVSRIQGARITTTMLCGLILVSVAPEPRMACSVEIINPITRAQLRGNFITLDDRYVMLADGRIFYVQEE